MGAIREILGKYKNISIEINKDNSVHLENPTFRLELSEDEYREFAATLLVSVLTMDDAARHIVAE